MATYSVYFSYGGGPYELVESGLDNWEAQIALETLKSEHNGRRIDCYMTRDREAKSDE